MAVSKTSRKSQHFLHRSDFHLVNMRKVLRGRKPLCFTHVGTSMEARGRTEPQGFRQPLLGSRGRLAQRGSMGDGPGVPPRHGFVIHSPPASPVFGTALVSHGPGVNTHEVTESLT